MRMQNGRTAERLIEILNSTLAFLLWTKNEKNSVPIVASSSIASLSAKALALLGSSHDGSEAVAAVGLITLNWRA